MNDTWTTTQGSANGRIGSFRLSPRGDWLAVDDTAAQIVGFPSGAALRVAGAAHPLGEAQERVRFTGVAPSPASFLRTWVARTGEERCARVLLVPAQGTGGAVEHFDGVIEELDPRACQVPASSTRFVESLLDALPSPVFVKDEQHRWVLLNTALCEFMGHERAQLIGKSDFDFFPPDEARVFWEKDDLVFAGGGVNENEERFTDASGRTHVIVTRKTLHVDPEGRRFLLGVITDITALREATDQLRASRDELEERVQQRTAELSAANALLRDCDARRGAFLSVLGHELRNPLSAISTSSSLLERLPPDSAAFARAHAVIGRQVAHLTRMCDDLLDASRLARGKLSLQRRVVDLAAVLENLCHDFAARFQQQHVTLAYDRPGERAWVDADETRLAQSIGNLLHNALKFTPSGGRVAVTLRRPDGRVEVDVRDSGIGLAPEETERVFEPFVQALDGPAGARGGLGLGLAIAKGFVEAHGGTVVARSDGRDRGTAITVSLPAAPEPSTGASRAASASPARDLCVVVIEDEPDFRESLAELLRLEGYRVEAACDGRAGIELVRSVRPDAVLCDIGLPDLDGCEVAQRIRADPDRAVAATRLVALSGFARTEDVDRSLAAGFDAHLSKPPSLASLEALLARRAAPPA